MSAAAPIVYRRRDSGALETEQVYGGGLMAWAYGSASGRLFVRAAASRPWFSALVGWWMRRPWTRHKIAPFIQRYGIAAQEMLVPPGGFRSFNDFFIRKLVPGARPVSSGPGRAVLPADGRHLVYPVASAADGFVVKGQRFDLGTLLGSSELGRDYADGALLLSRLCPVDYHRFHFPCAGRPGPARRLPGPLYSVSPIALRGEVGILAANRRQVTLLESPDFGRVALCEIGATNVGSIGQTFVPGERVEAGQEKGYFSFGGSSLALVFPPGRIRFCEDLVEASRMHRETLARMGEPLGQVP